MNLLRHSMLLWATLILTACSLEPYYPEDTTLLEGQTFNRQVVIKGNQYDGMVIRNCTFEGINANSGLRIESVNNLVISNCIFRNITGHGIRLWHTGEGTSNVQIIGNRISNVYANGLLSGEINWNTMIRGNHISHVGLDWANGTLNGAPHHGIYWQGPGFTIESNTIYANYDVTGNIVSVRTWGTIRGNKLYHSSKRGITYYSDHPGYGGQLLIENNIVFDNGINAVGLDSNGTPANHIGSVIIRFNTLVQKENDTIRINESMAGLSSEIYGNIIITEDPDGSVIKTSLSCTQYQNILTNGDIGFVDFSKRNLLLTTNSPAAGYANGITTFTSNDIQGEIRPQGLLDAGADEI